MSERTIPQLVQAAAERFGDRPAIKDGEVNLTFAQLAEAGLRAAQAFSAAGLQPGDRVAVWAPNIHEWIIALIGLQSAGGVLVPLNTRLKGTEAGYILAKSGARFLCTEEEFLGKRYVDELHRALGASALGRPIASLSALERIILLRPSEHAGPRDGSGPRTCSCGFT
jgi:acyl-CoA synthetase (AMP-forming)/AMP-acid ligase II